MDTCAKTTATPYGQVDQNGTVWSNDAQVANGANGTYDANAIPSVNAAAPAGPTASQSDPDADKQSAEWMEQQKSQYCAATKDVGCESEPEPDEVAEPYMPAVVAN